MTCLRFILGDQLSHNLSSLQDCDKKNDIIFLCEVWEETQYVRHHQKKIAFIFSAMRHFSKELQEKQFNVEYVKLDEKNKTLSFTDALKRMIKKHQVKKVIITFPGEHRVLSMIKSWEKHLNVDVEIREDDRFLCSQKEFYEWAGSRKQLRMENFYRMMRKKHNILMDGEKPIGGQWNFDKENRKIPKDKLNIPPTYHAKNDAITKEVIDLVSKKFSDHFGEIEPFYFAVTRKAALDALKQFIQERLPLFGDYQDAMLDGEAWLFHSHLSFYLNVGLLYPLECIKAAEAAYSNELAPLNAVEGFIRQILGWREYVRGLYWLKMPEYSELNFLKATNQLPDFYWNGNTKMYCLQQCIKETQKNAYAHHIQRLMVLGNFALLIGANPREVNEWYLIVYADAFEWVELPNVTGMILFADGGILGSKPYAASGSYINRMSNYCKQCQYKVNIKSGEEACPFNYLYWDFIIRHRNVLEGNQRMRLIYSALDKMPDDTIKKIKADSHKFLKKLKT